MIAGLFNITFIAECCALMVAIILLNKKTTLWQFFILFLFITVLAETVGWYLAFILHKPNNNWVYNILLVFSGSFSLWIIANAEPFRKARTKLNGGMLLFVVFALCNLLFFQGPWKYNGYTEILGDLLMSVYCCYFFYRVLTESVYRDLFRYEYFWLANGFLFSSLGSVVLYIFLDALTMYYRHTNINIYGYINYGLNVLLYGSLIISFICRNRNTKSLQVL
jgi:hypothetical protein